MKLVRTINAWTCLAAAIASQLHYTLPQLFVELEHDGSEVVRFWLDDPHSRRGFHPQEMIELAQRHNYFVTQVDFKPSAKSDLDSLVCYFDTILGEDCEARFNRNLLESFGWIDCRTRRGTGHALAYENATIGDPATGEMFTYQSKQDAELRGLYFVSLFRLDSMENPNA